MKACEGLHYSGGKLPEEKPKSRRLFEGLSDLRLEDIMGERRQKVRLGMVVEINYSIASEFLKSGSRSKNISEEGICVPTNQRLDPGTVLDMEIRLAEGKQAIHVRAQVIWSSDCENPRYPFEAGVKFIDIAEAEKEKIKRAVQKLSSGQDGCDVRWMAS